MCTFRLRVLAFLMIAGICCGCVGASANADDAVSENEAAEEASSEDPPLPPVVSLPLDKKIFVVRPRSVEASEIKERVSALLGRHYTAARREPSAKDAVETVISVAPDKENSLAPQNKEAMEYFSRGPKESFPGEGQKRFVAPRFGGGAEFQEADTSEEKKDSLKKAVHVLAPLSPTADQSPLPSEEDFAQNPRDSGAPLASSAEPFSLSKGDQSRASEKKSGSTGPGGFFEEINLAALSPHAGGMTSFLKESGKDQAVASKAFSNEQAAAVLRQIVGGDRIPLNVRDGASSADVQMPVHIDEAVAFALKNNFEILASEEKSTGAYWDKMGAYAQYLPTVNISADTGPERSRPASYNDESGNREEDSTHHRRDHSVTVSVPLIDLGIVADILSASDKKDLADINQADVREGIAYDTAVAYLSLLQARITVQLAENYKQYLDNLAVRMKARVDGGGASSADLDRIRGRSATAEGARIEALGEYQTQMAEFKRLTKLTPPELILPPSLAPSIPESLQEATEMALKTNPTYKSSLKKVDLAENDRNKSMSGLLPKLSFMYSNTYAYNAGGAADGNPADGVYPTQKTQNVMLVAQWALNGGTSVTSTLSGMAKEREMNMHSLDVRSKIEQALRSSYASINAGHERQAALQKTMEANERVVKGFEFQFTNGSRSLFDLLDSYEQLYNARLNFLRVTVACSKATYQVHRQMGKLISAIIRDRGDK